MRILKKYCDHCGKEIYEDVFPTVELSMFNYCGVSKRSKNMDLCANCGRALYDFIYPEKEVEQCLSDIAIDVEKRFCQEKNTSQSI